MFKLSQTHNQAFQTKAEADFVREVMQYLRENHAETIVKLPNGDFKVEDLPEETLRKMVEGGIVKARGYGITWRSALISFVVLMFIFAPNFDQNFVVSKILNYSLLHPNWRIKELSDGVTTSTLEQIKENYNTLFWIN